MRRLLCVIVLAAVMAGCADSAPQTEAPVEATLTTQQLMAHVLEPAADRIWDSAGFIMTEAGEESLAPTTEEGWLDVQHGAAVVTESGNLLMVAGRSEGREEWIAISRGLIDVGQQAMAAAEAQDADALFEAGSALYGVCLACHQVYWADGGRFTD